MPKRSTHTYASEENQDVSQLQVYYCLYCGHQALIIDSSVDNLPTRKTDQSTVLETKAHMHKIMLDKGEQKLIKRAGGYERQFRLNCSKCELPVAYQCAKDSPEHIFILPGAISATPKVSFNEVQVPGSIQPTKSGEVKMKVHVTYEGPRCEIVDIGEDAVELKVKDCSHLGEEKAEEKQKDLLYMFLQKTLGLASKAQIKTHMGKNMRTKILMIADIPPKTVYDRLLAVQEAASEIRMGYVDKHGQATAELFERMPTADDGSGTYGTGSRRKKIKPTTENPFPDQPSLPSGSKR